MAKRLSQDPSPSPVPMATGGDGDAVVNTLQKPPKRLKTADGSAATATSPTASTKAHSQATGADEESSEQNPRDDGAVDEKDIQLSRKSARTSIRTEHDGADAGTGVAVGAEGEVDDDAGGAIDAGDMTVVYPETHETRDANDGLATTTAAATTSFPTNANSKVGSNNNKMTDPSETLSTISEDSDADVPTPRKGAYHHLTEDEINYNEPQVTVCVWDGCTTGDLGTMDRLVEHLHGEHVEGKQRRYTCEWVGCTRKGKSHASAYALKAHLRSHTREKPHVCLLPECDQAFARQDALNKHMRTSHEIDLMRSIDTASRASPWNIKGSTWATHGIHGNGAGTNSALNGSAANGSFGSNGNAANGSNGKGAGSSKLKIIIKTPQSHAAGKDDSIDYGSVQGQAQGGSAGSGTAPSGGFTFVNEAGGAADTVLTRDQGFSARELDMPMDKLYGLCQCQLRWAEEESQALRRECGAWEETNYQAWLEAQVLLDQVIQSEKDWHERRKTVLASLAVEEVDKKKKRHVAASAAAAVAAPSGDREEADDVEDGEEEDEDEEDDDSAGDEDNDNEDGDEDDDVTVPDLDATQDDLSFADNTAFAHVGSSLRNELVVNGD